MCIAVKLGELSYQVAEAFASSAKTPELGEFDHPSPILGLQQGSTYPISCNVSLEELLCY